MDREGFGDPKGGALMKREGFGLGAGGLPPRAWPGGTDARSLDLSGRPFVVWEVELPECLPLGQPAFDPQLAEHAVSSFATAAGITLHVELVRGRNVHHIIEATFKGLARCLRDAVRIDGRGGVPSTKGVL